LPDLFEPSKASELSKALDQSVLGSLSFNGQRCTALKLFFIPKAHGDAFASQLATRVEALTVGLPWQSWPQGDGKVAYSQITPLPYQKRVDLMKRLIDDAVKKGAKILNQNGGTVVGGPESTLMVPAVLYPVTPDMDVYHEEQFGPIIPIATYDDIDTVLEYGQKSIYGQQVSIFTSIQEASTAAMMVDRFSSVYGKININSQCGRSPDTLPFSGRRSSAMGVMSVKDSLREFSIPTVVAYQDSEVNAAIAEEMELSSKFMSSL
jgi:glyceraldehyde-3-phosphate dehydrogenase (NADP+)